MPSCGDNSTLEYNKTQNATHIDTGSGSESDLNSTSDDCFVESVRYAYMLIGSFCILPTLGFGCLFLAMSPSCFLKDKEGWQYTALPKSDETKYHNPKRSTNQRKWFAFLVIFHLLYPVIEGVFGTFIAVFVVKSLGWGVRQGATITAVFYGAICVGRLLGIPAARILAPQVMITVSLILACVAYMAMLFSSSMHYQVVYCTVIMAGIAVSTLVASKLLWVSQFLVLSGFVLGICQAAGSLGAIVIFPLVGYLFQNVNHIWLMYVVLTASLLQLFFFSGCCFVEETITQRVSDIASDPN